MNLLIKHDLYWATPGGSCAIYSKEMNLIFGCAEAYFAAHKSKDENYRINISKTMVPYKILYWSSDSTMRKENITIDSSFKKNKVKIMEKVMKEKFSQNLVLAYFLKQLKGKIIYDAPWDGLFGTGKYDEGKNELGIILERIRDGIPKSFVSEMKKLSYLKV